MNQALVDRCRNRLIEISRQGETITYGDLAHHLQINNQSVGKYLTEIYNQLVIGQKLPDLTLLVVYKGTKYGRYNSRGESSQSVEFDPMNKIHCDEYDKDRATVYKHWSK